MPLFVAGFVGCVLIRSAVELPPWLVEGARLAQTLLLATAMFALGLGVKVATLRAVGIRPVILGSLSTGFVAAIAAAGVFLAGS